MFKQTNLDPVKIQTSLPSFLGQIKPGFCVPGKHHDNTHGFHFLFSEIGEEECGTFLSPARKMVLTVLIKQSRVRVKEYT